MPQLRGNEPISGLNRVKIPNFHIILSIVGPLMGQILDITGLKWGEIGKNPQFMKWNFLRN
jgi:hypothetical protein